MSIAHQPVLPDDIYDAARLNYAHVGSRVQGSLGCGAPLDAVALEEGNGVLGLGCGSGEALVNAASRVGPKGFAIGVDMAEPMVSQARERIRCEGIDNADVRLGFIESVPLFDASVDRVISNCVVCLSPEKDRVFAEIARVLKPGGRFCLADIVLDSRPAWLRALLQWRGSCLATAADERTYTEGLAAAGLENIVVENRVAYDASRMRAFIDPNLPRALWCIHGVGELVANTLAKAGWRLFHGRLASVRITGEKPGAQTG